MRKLALLSTSLAATLIALLPAPPAQALNNKSFVSSTGVGTACTRAAPCNNFDFAHAATIPGGEINCLDSGPDSGPFGGAIISKSITIDCAGLAATSFLFIVNGAGIGVRIRNLSINGLGGTVTGIDFQNGAALFVENCVIQNFTSGDAIGIKFRPSAPGTQLVVTDTLISNNGNSGITGGIVIKPASGVPASVTIDRTRVENNFFGIVADGTGGGSVRGVVRDSMVSGNVNNGITASSSGAGSAVLMIENTTVSGNNFGLAAGGAGAGMLVSQSSIVLNNTGLFTAGGGVLLSYKNNNVNGNTTADGAFMGIIAQQ